MRACEVEGKVSLSSLEWRQEGGGGEPHVCMSSWQQAPEDFYPPELRGSLKGV